MPLGVPPISQLFGYHQRILFIDATTGNADFRPIDESTLRCSLGGSGLGTALLLDSGGPTIDPLSPAAPIAFVFSPLVGSPLTTSAKFAVVSRSPLTQRLNDSLASSHFAIAGKKVGADAIVITGRAPTPSLLLIDEETIRFEPAGELWGMEIPPTAAALDNDYPRDFAWGVIGPAGENLVRFATISHDGRHAGRGGSGAILGAKNIKAIGVRGNVRCQFARPEKLIELARELSRKSFGPATAKYRELGTATNLLTFNRLHALPTRNFQQGEFDAAAAISPEQLETTREKTRKSCACCTIGCEHLYPLNQRDNSGTKVRLEYENLFALGPLCGIGDPDVVLAASSRCDALGLDTISAGGTIAFAMECAERKLLDVDWLSMGSSDSLLRAIELIARRDGIGTDLAEGSRRLALALGNNTIDFAPQVKGLEIPGYDPRALQTMALGFAVGHRGADHNRSGAYEIDFSNQVDRRNVDTSAIPLAIATEDKAALIDSAILCKFLRGVFVDFHEELAEMLNLVTGWEISAGELRKTAQQLVQRRKEFNVAAGWTPAEDRLPERILSQPLPDDPQARLSHAQLQRLVSCYNEARGWTSDGWPGETLPSAADKPASSQPGFSPGEE